MAITIQPLNKSQIEGAKAVIIEGCLEFFGHPPLYFADMEDIESQSQYAPPPGTFLVLMDGERVVGTGAVRRLDAEICELKRLWFLPPYRGKGHGAKMVELLFGFARSAGYHRMRLDSSPDLEAANRLYRRLGFYDIDRYNDGPATVFMEKQL